MSDDVHSEIVAELLRAQNENSRFRQELRQLEASYQQTQRSTQQSLQDARAQAEREIASLRQLRISDAEVIAAREAELRRAENDLQQLQRNMQQTLQETREQTERELTNLRQLRQADVETIAARDSDLQHVAADLRRAENDLQQLQRSAQQSIQDIRAQADREIASLRQLRQTDSETILAREAELQTVTADLQQAENDCQTLQRTVQQLTDRRGELESLRGLRHSDTEALAARDAEIKVLTSDVRRLEIELQQQQRGTQQGVLDARAQSDREIASLRQLRTLDAEVIAARESDLQLITADLRRVENEYLQLQRNTQQVIQEARVQSDREIASLRQLRTLDAEALASRESDVQMITAELRRVETDYQQLQRNTQQVLQDTRAQTEKEQQGMRQLRILDAETLAAREADLQVATANLQRLESDYSHLQRTSQQAFQEARMNAEREIADLSQTVAARDSDLQVLTSDLRRLENEYQHLQRTSQQAIQDVHMQTDREIENLRQTMTRDAESVLARELEMERIKADRDINSLRQLRSLDAETITNLTNEVRKCETLRQQDAQSMQQLLDNAQSEIAQLRTAVSGRDADLVNHKAALQQLTADLRNLDSEYQQERRDTFHALQEARAHSDAEIKGLLQLRIVDSETITARDSELVQLKADLQRLTAEVRQANTDRQQERRSAEQLVQDARGQADHDVASLRHLRMLDQDTLGARDAEIVNLKSDVQRLNLEIRRMDSEQQQERRVSQQLLHDRGQSESEIASLRHLRTLDTETIAARDVEVSNLKADLQRLATDVRQMDIERQQDRRAAQQLLQDTTAQANQLLATTREQADTAMANMKQLRAADAETIRAREQEVAGLKAEVNRLHDELRQVERESHRSRRDAEHQLQESLEKANAELASLKQRLLKAETSSDVSNLQSDIQRLSSELRKAEQERQQDRRLAQQTQQELRSQCDSEVENIRQMRFVDQETIRVREAEISNLKSELQRFTVEWNSTQKVVHETRVQSDNEVSNLKQLRTKDSETIRARDLEITNMKSDLQRLTAELRQMETDRQQERRHAQQLLEHANEHAEAEIGNLKQLRSADAEVIRTRDADLSTVKMALQRLTEEDRRRVAHYDSTVRDFQTALASFRSELSLQANTMVEIQDVNVQLLNELAALQHGANEETQTLVAKNDELAKQEREAQEALADLSERLVELQANLQAQADSAKRDAATLQLQIDLGAQQQERLKTTNQELQHEMESMQNQLGQSRQQAEHSQRLVDQLQQQLADAERNFQGAKVDELRKTVDEKMHSIRRSAQEMVKESTEYSELLQDLRQRTETAETALNHMQKRARMDDEVIKEIRAELMAKLTRVTADHKRLSEENVTLSDQLATERQRTRDLSENTRLASSAADRFRSELEAKETALEQVRELKLQNLRGDNARKSSDVADQLKLQSRTLAERLKQASRQSMQQPQFSFKGRSRTSSGHSTSDNGADSAN